MKNIKKSLLMVATGLVATTAITIIATNQNSILHNSFADEPNPNDRALVLDSSTPLNVSEPLGHLAVGNIGVYASNCTSLDNGVVTMNSGGLYLYCATAGMNGTYRYGFNGSTVSSLSLELNSRGQSGTVTVMWVKLTESYSQSVSSYKVSRDLTDTSENQTITVSGSNNFINGQGNGYPCIYIYYSKSAPLDIFNLTVQYTCK